MRAMLLRGFLRHILRAIGLCASTFWKGLRWFFGSKTLWSGLIPTALLAIAAFSALKKTSDQIEILREQMSYVRQPVLVVYLRPVDDLDRPVLHLANIGNDSVDNVKVRVRLFLVKENDIYSFGLSSEEMVYWFGDTLRTPKERQLPRLTLAPNEDRELASKLYLSLLPAYRTVPPGKDSVIYDLRRVRSILGGEFILSVECSYRRKTDFAKYADTTWLHYDPWFGFHTELSPRVGGLEAIRRLKKYVEHGPEMSIVIRDEEYVVWRSTFGAAPTIVKRLPKSDERCD